MLYFFRNKFMNIKWHDDASNRKFMLEIFDKIKEHNFISVDDYQINTLDVSRFYFQDGSYRNEVSFIFKTSFEMLSNLVGETGGEGRIFGNVILTNLSSDRTILFSDLTIVSTNKINNTDFVMIKAIPSDCIDLKINYSSFIENILKTKKIDTAYFPYDNDKDFFLL